MGSVHDFDFLFGQEWHVDNRRLAREGGDAWDRFAARAEVRPLMGGLGHLDRLWFDDMPGAGAVEAFTVRLYEPGTDTWRIWWASSGRPGHLDPPLTGRFDEGLGSFEGDDLPGARPVRLRFLWKPNEPAGPRWEQARSADDGVTWTTDWTMDLTRAGR